jgi:hypothetical protein
MTVSVYTREGLGRALTWDEGDANFENLATEANEYLFGYQGDATALAPSATEDGYAVVWDDTNQMWTLAASSGGDSIYSADGDIEADRSVAMDGNTLTFYHGAIDGTLSALLSFNGGNSGTLLEPRMTLHDTLATANDALINFGKNAGAYWNDGTRSTTVHSIQGQVNGSDVFQHIEYNFYDTRVDFQDIGTWNWNFETTSGTKSLTVTGDDGSTAIWTLGSDGEVQFLADEDGGSDFNIGSSLTDRYGNFNVWAQSFAGLSAGSTNDRVFVSLFGDGIGGVQIGQFTDETDFLGFNINLFGDEDLEVVDDLNGKGIIYAADYSATFVERSLVDKGYVDGAFIPIDQTEAVSTDGNSQVLQFGSNSSSNSYSQFGVYADLFFLHSQDYNDSDRFARLTLNSATPSMALYYHDENSDETGFFWSAGAVSFQDEIGSLGIVYAADYSSNFTDRSLVDKAYVDGVAGGGVAANPAMVTGLDLALEATTSFVVVSLSANPIGDGGDDYTVNLSSNQIDFDGADGNKIFEVSIYARFDLQDEATTGSTRSYARIQPRLGGTNLSDYEMWTYIREFQGGTNGVSNTSGSITFQIQPALNDSLDFRFRGQTDTGALTIFELDALIVTIKRLE